MSKFDEIMDYDTNDLILATGYTYDLYFPNHLDIYKPEINLLI